MNHSARRPGSHALYVLALAAAAAAIPAIALGDPPATGAPSIPGPFVGAPTNGDPNAGQFTFDVSHRSFGRAPERYGRLVEAGPLARRQASGATGASQRRAVDRIFVTFAGRLKELATPSAVTLLDSPSDAAR